MPNLERIYFVNPPLAKAYAWHGLQSPAPSRTSSTDGLIPTGHPIEIKRKTPRFSQLPHEILRENLIDAMSKMHGMTLRHISLPARLPVNVYKLARLVASCPNLIQLAFAVEEINPEALKHTGPGARRLRRCRILAPSGPGLEDEGQRKRWDEFESQKGP